MFLLKVLPSHASKKLMHLTILVCHFSQHLSCIVFFRQLLGLSNQALNKVSMSC